jgi:hypothetical protein
MIASAAGACAQQTEQLSLPNVTVTAPAAAPAVAPYLRDPGKPTSEILIMVGIASRRTDFARSRVRRPASPLPREANACRGLWGEQGRRSGAHDLLAPVYGLVHRRLRHRRPEGRQSAARRVDVSQPPACLRSRADSRFVRNSTNLCATKNVP